MIRLATRRLAVASITLLCAATVCGPTCALEPRVGLLLPPASADSTLLVDAFRRGLAQASSGAGPEATLIIRTTGADGAAELAGENIDVAVGASLVEVQELRRALPAKPIVMIAVGDPVGAGLAASLERPGGTITGLSDFREDFPEKRLQLVRELMPAVRRVGFLHNPAAPTARLTVEAAGRLGIDLLPLAAPTPAGLQAVLSQLSAGSADALLVVPYPLTFRARRAIAQRAALLGLPLFFGYADYMDVEGGGGAVASYGANLAALYARSAAYVRAILNGALPADLPIDRPDRGELILDLAAARRLGLVVPDDVLRRADRVVR